MPLMLRRGCMLAAAALLATAIGAEPLYAVDDNTKADRKKTTASDSKSKKAQDTTAPVGNPGYPNEPPHGSGY